MRFNLRRRGRPTFLQPRSGFRQVLAAAGREAGPDGIDSLHLLIATFDDPAVARIVASLGADPGGIRAAARRAMDAPDAQPGLTADAKSVIEAAMHRALLARSRPDTQDLVVGLATADCRARQVVASCGVDLELLVARAEGRSRG